MSLLIWQIATFVVLSAFGLSIYFIVLLKRALEASLKREEKAYSELLDFPAANPNPVLRINKMGMLTFANPASAPIMVQWKINLNEKIPSEWREVIRQVDLSGKDQAIDIACGNSFYTLNIVPMGKDYVSIFGMDITARKLAEKELERRSTTDELTGLPNRVIFEQNMMLEINHARKSQVKLGIFIIRLDDYFEIVNTYGQSVADKFLKQFKDRLIDFVAGNATVARVSDNEFGVIEAQIHDPSGMASYVQSLIEKCTIPYKIADHDIFITLSVGIAFYPSDGDTPEILTRNAQLAVNRTSSTRNQYEFFQRGMIDQLQVKRNIITDLHKALERQQFLLYYQPQIQLKNNQMVGVEALIRWNHPQKGFISPFFFMTAAEETQLINPIGEWVLREACSQINKWQHQGHRLKVGVNVSARQLFSGDFVDLVRRVIRDTKISPDLLELELTESALVQDISTAIDIMKAFRALGVELALDDFGTGYSSLSYLMQFPVNKIKIDRSFVKIIEDDKEENYAVTRGIIELGHSLNLKVIAEGVETKTQLRYLKQHKCDLIQGYYFSQPQGVEKFPELFKKDWKS